MLVLPFFKKNFCLPEKVRPLKYCRHFLPVLPLFFHKKFSFLLAPSAAAKQYLHQFPLCKRGRRKKRTHFPSWSFASKGGEKSEQMHTPTHIFCTQTRSNKCWAGAEKGERESALLCVIIHATPHPFPTPIAIPPTHRPTIIFLLALNEGVRRRRGKRGSAEGA